MCGILAILVNQKENEKLWVERAKQLITTMAHRGPDAEKVEQYKSVVFGHRRLAILDLSDAGIQPMVSDDGRFIIVHNGEIYNYIEIREELKELGEKFHTETDTEVLLSAYRLFGVDLFSKINGMYAFIILDKEKEELLIARDRFGIKPLYYSRIGDDLIFSSEIKPIIATRDDLKPNYGIIFDFLIYSAIDHSDETFLENIFRFPAGHYVLISKDKMKRDISFTRYWNLKEEVKKLRSNLDFKRRKEEEHIDMIRKLFFDAVNFRLRSDVQVGSCLSGGIDSSSIVSVISEFLEGDSRKNFETFSMVYGDWFEKSEKKYIDVITKKTSFNPNYTTPDVPKINEAFDKFLLHQEEPVTSLSPIGQFFVMELARKNGTTVLLDGQGADEILAGYLYLRGYFLFDLFRRLRLFKLMNELWQMRKHRPTIKYFLAQFSPKFILEMFRKKDFRNYLGEKFRRDYSSKRPPGLINIRKPFNEMLINLLEFKIPHLLRWEDKSSMAFSIETRVPFLDHNFVRYVLSLPSEYIVHKGVTKWIFRKAMAGIAPEEILARTDKIGFAVPENIWVNDEQFDLINDLKNNPHPEILTIVNFDKVNKLIKKQEEETLLANETKFLFCLSCLNRWFKLFFEGKS